MISHWSIRARQNIRIKRAPDFAGDGLLRKLFAEIDSPLALQGGYRRVYLDDEEDRPLPPVRGLPIIPLFDQETDHSFAPTKVRSAVARSAGEGRPSGRRVSASPLTGASTMAAL